VVDRVGNRRGDPGQPDLTEAARTEIIDLMFCKEN
jgi:hypothetical protein